MSQTKSDQAISHLWYLRQESREMYLDIQNNGLCLDTGPIRGVMAQMQVFLELIEGNSKLESSYDLISPMNILIKYGY